MMNIETKLQDGITVILMHGEIDGKTAPEAQEKLLPIVAAHKTVVMDMGNVTFMSSAGLRMMLLLYRHATAGNGKVALVGLSEQIQDTMTATGFLDFFVVSGNVQEAVASLKVS
ncbi:MAG: STAS domain-containing protein [Kiritimatiellae bacterium]|nr:STAS domain-containing protein [Kiritimatiellia bacterium]MDD5519751.1 STAS domain-containing protein [Kiritimatiellia bacterium]